MKEYTSSEQPSPQASNVLHSVNWMSAGVATLLSIGMIVDRNSVTVSVLSGVAFYAAIAGTLVATPLILNHQDQVTIRRRDELPYLYMPQEQAQRRVALVDPLQIPSGPSLPATPSYVPAVARAKDELKVAAAGWVTQLFDGETGRPLSNRITKNKGNIQLKSPEEEVTAYLCGLGIISQDTGKRLYFNSDACPTLRQAINAIKRGDRIPSTGGGIDGWEGGS